MDKTLRWSLLPTKSNTYNANNGRRVVFTALRLHVDKILKKADFILVFVPLAWKLVVREPKEWVVRGFV